MKKYIINERIFKTDMKKKNQVQSLKKKKKNSLYLPTKINLKFNHSMTIANFWHFLKRLH